MRRVAITAGTLAAVLVLPAFSGCDRSREEAAPPTAATAPPAAGTHPAAETREGFLYGRVATLEGSTYEGRLRWGGDEEAFWGDYCNGTKDENPWAAHAPVERFSGRRRRDLERPFMARFGDIARIEARGLAVVRVTLKSGTVHDLDRFEAGDFDDGVRVWDDSRGVVDLDSLRVRWIEFLPNLSREAAPYRLHGTVRTRRGEFTGFVQWDREKCVGPDTLDGRTAEGDVSLPFDSIRSIARRSREDALVTLLDGREIVLSGARDVGRGNRGMYVDDRRYGRVLVSWDAFERVDFNPGGSGPAYGDFPPGRPLTGRVTTRAGVRLAGRLVYDLDESETTETLDAPSEGVDYTVPFGLIASIVPSGRGDRGAPRARVTLHTGEELQLENTGDLGSANAGMLIFVDGGPHPEYVPWTDVERIELDRLTEMELP